MFIDADSDANRAEGRNGKSFIMEQDSNLTIMLMGKDLQVV